MTSTKNNPSPDPTRKPDRTKRPLSQNHSAMEKAQAVLAVWTDRCKAAEVCRQLNIRSMTFHQWQSRAMEGMLQALETRVNLARGQVLSPRLQTLLQKRALPKLQARLQQIQLAKTSEPASQP
jgi:transposase-like protein